jgi:type II secretory pathway component GspD/PulD (secretin)
MNPLSKCKPKEFALRELAVVVVTATLATSSYAGKDSLTLRFTDADIHEVASVLGEYVGKSFIVDPKLRGKISFKTSTPVTLENASSLFIQSLRKDGCDVVEESETNIKIMSKRKAETR